jgi:hypothetical protein
VYVTLKCQKSQFLAHFSSPITEEHRGKTREQGAMNKEKSSIIFCFLGYYFGILHNFNNICKLSLLDTNKKKCHDYIIIFLGGNMSNLSEEVSRNNNYTWLHIEVIELLIPKYEEYIYEYVANVPGLSPCYTFGGNYIVEISGFNENIISKILHDFVKEGLLFISARHPNTSVYSVTFKGYNCFGKIVKLFKETE